MPFDDTLLQRLRDNNPTLTHLDLGFGDIHETEIPALAAVLEKNKTLTTLTFERSKIGDMYVKFLADMLKKNQTLTRLDLEQNDISDIGAKNLAEALEENQTLTKLSLMNNKISAAGTKDLATMLEKNQTLIELGLSVNRMIGDAGAKDLAAALEKNQTLRSLYLFKSNISPAGKEDLGKALQNNFSLCEIICELRGDNLPKEVEALLERNQKLVTTREAATTALNASRETLSIPREEIQEKQTELSLSAAEAHAIIKFKRNIGILNDAIRKVETAQTRMASKTSEGAQRVKEDLQRLHDECVSEEIKLLTNFHSAIKDKLNIAIDSMVEHIPEASPLFNHARFLLFQAAYSGYQDDNYPPTQALVEALPLLRKDDGTLLTDFLTTSKDIEGMLFKPAEQQRVFDSAVLAAAGHDVVPGKDIALTNIERADLLRFVLLRYAKDIATETDIKHSKMAGTLFAGTKKEIPAPLRKSLATLPSSFDVTKPEERENVRKLFDEAYGDLEDLLSKTLKETEAITDLKNCHELMAPLSTKPITPEVSPKPPG